MCVCVSVSTWMRWHWNWSKWRNADGKQQAMKPSNKQKIVNRMKSKFRNNADNKLWHDAVTQIEVSFVVLGSANSFFETERRKFAPKNNWESKMSNGKQKFRKKSTKQTLRFPINISWWTLFFVDPKNELVSPAYYPNISSKIGAISFYLRSRAWMEYGERVLFKFQVNSHFPLKPHTNMHEHMKCSLYCLPIRFRRSSRGSIGFFCCLHIFSFRSIILIKLQSRSQRCSLNFKQYFPPLYYCK